MEFLPEWSTITRDRYHNMSHIMRELDFCKYKNKDVDQLCSKCTADLHLCFRSMDNTMSLLLISKISSIKHSSVTVQIGMCQTWSETLKTGFLTSQLICVYFQAVLSLPSPQLLFQ